MLPIIQAAGLVGIFAIVFAESGLFFGFFLPGDSLLFTAGLLASLGHFNVIYLFLGSFVCAVLGDSVGYWMGVKLGPKIFSRPNSFLWKKENIEKTQKFYEKYGKKTIILARFVPIVRTFAPILAGVGQMKYKDFAFFNVVGGFLWTATLIFLGYFLGNNVKNIDHYIWPITGVIILVSFIPLLKEYFSKK